MKRILTIIVIAVIGISAFAQNDTTLINKKVTFDKEVVVTKSGKENVKYYAIIDGKYYDTTKTTIKRYKTIVKFGGIPNVAIVENKKKTNSKIIVL